MDLPEVVQEQVQAFGRFRRQLWTQHTVFQDAFLFVQLCCQLHGQVHILSNACFSAGYDRCMCRGFGGSADIHVHVVAGAVPGRVTIQLVLREFCAGTPSFFVPRFASSLQPPWIVLFPQFVFVLVFFPIHPSPRSIELDFVLFIQLLSGRRSDIVGQVSDEFFVVHGRVAIPPATPTALSSFVRCSWPSTCMTGHVRRCMRCGKEPWWSERSATTWKVGGSHGWTCATSPSSPTTRTARPAFFFFSIVRW
mmetsp:Transcript_5580/g.34636  ORF Transcript_5580/g.34636 Transcript_5580/m.34636 type:complete len:251 (+) Transcript_5580:2938-3690(+)